MAGVLDAKGVALAIFFGAVLFFYGGLSYLALMLFFFLLAVAATKYEYQIKKEMGLYEHQRGWENVLSNGLLPAILAFMSPGLGPIPFIASIAAISSDKFGSEVGVLDPDDPISMFSFRPVKPGTSGAMSRMGTVAALGSSFVIGLFAIWVFGLNPGQAILVGLAGFAGSIADTAFGVFEEQGIGTKGTTNFICSLVGALLAFFLIH